MSPIDILNIILSMIFGFLVGVELSRRVMLRKIKKAYSDGISDGLDLKSKGDILIRNIEKGDEE